jgi:DNA repair protein RecN (Recombination protein N)
MLQHLLVDNIAILDRAEVDFYTGFTVITGETGSGKSLLIDAIGLALGEKVSPKSLLRPGVDKARVELTVGLDNPAQHEAVSAILAQYGAESALDDSPSTLWLSRDFTPQTSRCRINGLPVPREALAALRPWLVAIQGQHGLMHLFQPSQQRHLVDAFGGPPVAALKAQVKQAYLHWSEAKAAYQALVEQQQVAQERLMLWQVQLAELEAVQLASPTEVDDLQAKLQRLSHGESLVQGAGQAVNLLHDTDNAASVELLLAKALKSLRPAASLDASLESQVVALEGVLSQTQELIESLTTYADSIDTDPHALSQVSERLYALEALQRKYAMNLPDLITKRDQLAHQVAQVTHSDEHLAQLQAAVDAAYQTLLAHCQDLTAARQQTAHRLQGGILAELQDLGLAGAQFTVSLAPCEPTAEGAETIQFMFTANPGMPLAPMAEIASGGELSRVLLAFQCVLAAQSPLSTLIFDEIDTGISGVTSKKVAEKLVQLGQSVQVLAITHQPIVIGQGAAHLHVQKQIVPPSRPATHDKARPETVPESVQTKIVMAYLDDPAARTQVLAELSSGSTVQDQNLINFAEALLKQA